MYISLVLPECSKNNEIQYVSGSYTEGGGAAGAVASQRKLNLQFLDTVVRRSQT